MPITRDEDQRAAMAAALPVLPELHTILSESVEFYFSDEEYSVQARAEHDSRAMKSCIYSHAETKAMAREASVPGLHCLDVRGLKLINFRDQVIFRLKSVDADGNHRNFQTKQQRDYDYQLPLEGLPDPAVRLVAGYELDEAGAGLKRVLIARKLGRDIVWTAQVNIDEDVADWEDITPNRFGFGSDVIDIEAVRARGRDSG